MKPWRHHADDREPPRIERDGAARDVPCRRELRPPNRITDQGDVCAGALVVAAEVAAERRLHAECGEDVRRHDGTRDVERAATVHESEPGFPIGGQMLERARGRSPVKEIGPRRRAGRAGSGRRAEVDAGDGGEALGRRKRQRPQQHRVNDAEHRAVRTDAEGEREHGDQGEPRRLPQRAAREAKVAREILEPSKAALVALRLPGVCDPSDPKSRSSYCAAFRIPPAPFFVSRQF